MTAALVPAAHTRSDGPRPASLAVVDLDLSAKNGAQLEGHGLPPAWRRLWSRLARAGREPSFLRLRPGDEARLASALRERGREVLLLHIDNFMPPGLASALSELSTLRGVPRVFACGYLPSARPTEVLARLPALDGVLRGPLEVVLPAVERVLVAGRDPLELANSVARGGPVRAYDPARLSASGLGDGCAEIPPDALQRMSFQGGVGIVQGSAGCPGRCAFCRSSAFYRAFSRNAYSMRPVDELVGEIDDLHRRCGIRHFKFYDLNFLGTPASAPRRARELAGALRARRLPVTFELHARSDALRAEVLDALVPVGLRHLAIGIESLSPSQLRRYEKGETVEDHRRAARLVAERGLFAQGYAILADPLVTRAELVENLAGLDELNRSVLVLIHERMILYRDTPYFERHAARLRVARRFDSSLGTVVDYAFSDEWVGAAFPLLERASVGFKAALAAHQRRFQAGLRGTELHAFVRAGTALRLELLRRVAEDDAPSPGRVEAWLAAAAARLPGLPRAGAGEVRA